MKEWIDEYRSKYVVFISLYFSCSYRHSYLVTTFSSIKEKYQT
jgi:hypothetical protein